MTRHLAATQPAPSVGVIGPRRTSITEPQEIVAEGDAANATPMPTDRGKELQPTEPDTVVADAPAAAGTAEKGGS